MAEKKKSSSTTTRRKSAWGINKISFYTICAVAILYLIASILALLGVSSKAVAVLQGIATAIMICIVAVLAWRYVASKPTVWKVLYLVILLVVLLGIVIPLVV